MVILILNKRWKLIFNLLNSYKFMKFIKRTYKKLNIIHITRYDNILIKDFYIKNIH